MKHYVYLIVGGGMTGDAAVRGIRELDSNGAIGLLCDENDMPYARPPLTKGMWKGRPFEKVWRGTEKLGVSFHLGRRAMRLNLATKRVRDDHGDEYSYDKVLLATGGSPIRLPLGGQEIIYYRTLRDYERLRALVEMHERFLVIGGGYIGSEITAAMRMQGKEVTIVSRESHIGESIFPVELSRFVTDYYHKKGIKLLMGETVDSVEKKGERFAITVHDRRNFEVDGIVAGLGLRPNVELAKSAGLAVEDGIKVDDHQRTSAAGVFAAGDVAMFPHAALGKLVRVEHEDNAVQMGKQAGRNMAGADEAYVHTPYFYSDLFELGYEAVGELSSTLETFADWEEPFQKGVVYYLDHGRVRGVLLWNIWEKIKEATALLDEPGPFKSGDLKSRITG